MPLSNFAKSWQIFCKVLRNGTNCDLVAVRKFSYKACENITLFSVPSHILNFQVYFNTSNPPIKVYQVAISSKNIISGDFNTYLKAFNSYNKFYSLNS